MHHRLVLIVLYFLDSHYELFCVWLSFYLCDTFVLNVVAFYVTQVYSWFSHSDLIDAGDLHSFWLLNRAAVSILKHASVLPHPFTVEIISEAQRVRHMLGFSRFYF